MTPPEKKKKKKKATTRTTNGQYVRVKRVTDTYFVSLDLQNGATLRDLHLETAATMDVQPRDLRLCLVSEDGRVTFLQCGDPTQGAVHAGGEDRVLGEPPLSFGLFGEQVVYAVLRAKDGWEQPCVVDYPPADLEVIS